MVIYIERVSAHAIEPIKATNHAACYDMYADVTLRKVAQYNPSNELSVATNADQYFTLAPHHRALIPTGFKMQAPEGYSIDFLSRSGTVWKYGCAVANSPGIIDHDYPNECFVLLENNSDVPFIINQGDRIAQMRLVKVEDTELAVVDELPPVDSNRTGGFNSTGK